MPSAIKPISREHPIRHVKSRTFYPWEDMDVGDWFYVPLSEGLKNSPPDAPDAMNHLHQRFRTMIAREVRPRFPMRKFLPMRMDDGVKVWRIK